MKLEIKSKMIIYDILPNFLKKAINQFNFYENNNETKDYIHLLSLQNMVDFIEEEKDEQYYKYLSDLKQVRKFCNKNKITYIQTIEKKS